jgi:predicted ester cyclase
VLADLNKEIVRRFISEAWNGGDLSVVDELIHPDYEVRGVGHGPEAVKRNMAFYRTAFPDLRTTIELLIAEGEWVAARLTLRGTQLGPLGNIPPSGKRISMNELVFLAGRGR